MLDVILDTIKDSLNMVPLLLTVYIVIELVELKWGNKIRLLTQKAGTAGPTAGAIGGSLPQCGFSVVGATLYTQRLITIGTLLAIYLSTSDEAIPVILSQPDKAIVIIPLILTKIAIAIIAGYSIDLIFRKNNKQVLSHIDKYESGDDNKNHHHENKLNETVACCGHSPSPIVKRFNIRDIFLHPTIHTIKVFAFILIVSLVINMTVFWIGEDAFNNLFAGHVLLQPFVAALVGLLPDCASSVAITELYLKGAITYGAVIAGLCASGGLGLLVLLKEEKNKKDIALIIALLYGISVLVGLTIQFFNISPSLM
jgi:hypothetical protein